MSTPPPLPVDETGPRRVAKDQIEVHDRWWYVSTIEVPTAPWVQMLDLLAHVALEYPAPAPFETMIFLSDADGGDDGHSYYTEKYVTRAEAEFGHARILSDLRAGINAPARAPADGVYIALCHAEVPS